MKLIPETKQSADNVLHANQIENIYIREKHVFDHGFLATFIWGEMTKVIMGSCQMRLLISKEQRDNQKGRLGIEEKGSLHFPPRAAYIPNPKPTCFLR